MPGEAEAGCSNPAAPTGAAAVASAVLSFQARFEQKWGKLTRPHVRALAWLIDAPDLLDPAAPAWGGKIATLAAMSGPVQLAWDDAAWLAALEQDPSPLDAALGTRFYSRLGLYAEKLMAFYFQQRGMLAAHGLQVRANKNDTVGEFDFLLRQGSSLLHVEFATKFYLATGDPDNGRFDALVGPNLADTLGAKMRKILDRQLALGRHPAAQALLPQPVDHARALVKGWLFYPRAYANGLPHPDAQAGAGVAIAGIATAHNRGFWMTLEQLLELDSVRGGASFVLVPRTLWLAPVKLPATGQMLAGEALRAAVQVRFDADPSPVMVAAVDEENGWLLERERGFIVPADWLALAGERRLAGTLPS
jgi:hypothetical protein